MAQPRRTTLILGLALGTAVLSGTGITLAASRQADATGTLAEGGWRLTSYSIWAGQTTTLIRSARSDDAPPASATQIIDWGDGSVETVSGATTRAEHTYEKVGTFTPRVTASGATRTPGEVTVSTVIGGYRVRESTVWLGEAVTLTYQTYAEADRVKISWGDGRTDVVRASIAEAAITHSYAKAGAFEVTVAPVNEHGTATPRKIGSVSVKKDATAPIATLARPSNPASARSWSVLTGTASDTGVGLRAVTLTAVHKRGANWRYYTGTAWRKAPSRAAAQRRARVITLTPTASGTWSMKFSVPPRGTVRITYTAIDKAGNRSAAKMLSQKTTG
ncbi:hypothetical protein AB0F81_24460 [Actinoplanes sp. NPDC024001]|uniref:hypothetical protein n=1 Tax=Actinoplanes sp. NPDC024001 TaxID=3154598 RepID=UPI0033DB86D9